MTSPSAMTIDKFIYDTLEKAHPGKRESLFLRPGTLYLSKMILAAKIEVAAECIQPLGTVNESETHTFFLLFLLLRHNIFYKTLYTVFSYVCVS